MEEQEPISNEQEPISNNEQNPVSKGKKTFKLTTLIVVSIIALLLGALIMFVLSFTGVYTPTKSVAKINGKAYSANDVNDLLSSYLGDDTNMKISLLLDSVDYEILNDKYELTDKEKEELENYIAYYTYYYGLSEDYARDYLNVTKLRELYYLDCLSKDISEEDVNNYYENDFVADIECEHILITADDENLTKEQALTVANEIISKLNSGATFESVVTEYENSEKYSEFVVHESFTCQSLSTSSDSDSILFSALESTFVDGLLSIDDNSFSNTPVETSYGYHVIYRKNQSEKPNLDEIKDEIIKTLAEEYAMSDEVDTTLSSKVLIDLRQENGFKIYNSDLKSAYNEYCESVTTVEDTESDATTDVEIDTNSTVE